MSIKYTIVDCTTGERLMTIEAKTPRGAVQIFRRGFKLAHNYPNVVPVLTSNLTW